MALPLPGFPHNPTAPLLAANPYQITLLADTSSSVFSMLCWERRCVLQGWHGAGTFREWAVSRVQQFTWGKQVRVTEWQMHLPHTACSAKHRQEKLKWDFGLRRELFSLYQ